MLGSQSLPAFLPALNHELLAVSAGSTLLLVSYYYGVQLYMGHKFTERQKSWVLTAFSSAIMTILSIPFVGYWLKTGELLPCDRLADYGCSFFVSYLLCDLAIGSIHYRSSISVLTGWIHHIVYVLLISLLVIPHDFSSLFSLCAVLELPTFLLAIGSLDPAYRNDYLFAAIFFATRIVLHIYVAVNYALRALSPTKGSWAPTIVLTCILPMHLMWMHNCISGILRRRKASKLARTVSQQPPPSSDTRPAPLHRIPSYLLSRPLVTSTLDIMRARRIASSTLLRRSRQEMLRLLHDVLREVDVGSDVVASDAEFPQAASDLQQSLAAYVSPAPRFRSIRRRVVGRIRRSLPDAYGAVQVAEVVDHYIDPVVSD